MKDTATVVVPPAIAYGLYKAYQEGTFGDIKDALFSDDKHAQLFQDQGINIEQADTIHGQPAENIEFDPNVFQFYDDTCAIQSQHLILQQYGIDMTQEELIAIAKENGWYAEGYGTPINMVGKLLEYFNVDVTGSAGNNIFNLSNELAQGHQIIVGVDSQELVYPEQNYGIDEVYGEKADHALVVVGVDTTDPDNVQVIVTDPGTGNRQMSYPADQFMDAWKDSDCFMVSTNDVPTNPTIPFTPINNFGGISIESLNRLSGMEIDLDNENLYDSFFDQLMDDPLKIDNLISQFDALFTSDLDESFSEEIDV